MPQIKNKFLEDNSVSTSKVADDAISGDKLLIPFGEQLRLRDEGNTFDYWAIQISPGIGAVDFPSPNYLSGGFVASDLSPVLAYTTLDMTLSKDIKAGSDNFFLNGMPGYAWKEVNTYSVKNDGHLFVEANTYGTGAGLTIRTAGEDSQDTRDILMFTGSDTTASDIITGSLSFTTGNADSNYSGNINILTGNSLDANGAGIDSHASGVINIRTGDGTDAGSGNLSIATGQTNSGGGTSGTLAFTSGDADTGNSGQVALGSGASDSGNTGDVYLTSGSSNSANSGNVNITSGGAGGTRGLVTIEGHTVYLQGLVGGVAIVNLLSAPASPVTGSIYFDTSINKLKVYNGTTWETITSV